MNSYQEAIAFIYHAIVFSDPALGLKNAEALDQGLGYPSRSYPVVHVAGSNGKGSVATKIAEALSRSGYTVGLYTSPHIVDFRERIAVNGEWISEEELLLCLRKLLELGPIAQHATYFELSTFLALEHFRARAVDIAVIETGLGGRLDATNVVSPLLTVITSISREHSWILGKDLEQIAREKAGILKPQVPVVLGPKARYQSIYDRAKLLQCPVHVAKHFSLYFDEENSATAQLALEQLSLQMTITPQAIREGIVMRPRCRFERRGEVILDVAHNPDAIFSLLQALHHFYPGAKFRFVVGFSKDKECDVCLDLIAGVAVHIHLVQAKNPRSATVEELAHSLEKENPSLFTTHGSVEEGVKEGYDQALLQGEMLVVCGSFFLMEEAMAVIDSYPPADSLKSSEKILPEAFSSSLI
ncbi:MAG: Mur ligase family protein [Chlamydiota bacterium]